MNNIEAIKEWIEEKRKSWIPETKKEDGYGYHGSNKGEYLEYELYYDVKDYEWVTDKETAFMGFIYKELDKIIKQQDNG